MPGAAGSRQAFDQAQADRVGHEHHNDGYGGGGLLRRRAEIFSRWLKAARHLGLRDGDSQCVIGQVNTRPKNHGASSKGGEPAPGGKKMSFD